MAFAGFSGSGVKQWHSQYQTQDSSWGWSKFAVAYAEILQGIGVEQWHSQDFDRGGDLAVAYAEFLQGEGDEQ